MPTTTRTQNVYGQPWVDRGMPGRLFRGVKRLLGNPAIKRLLVFDHPFRLVALITPVLLRIRKTIERDLPDDLNDIHFGHPVLFEGHEALRPGQIVTVEVDEASEYDLWGKLV